LWWNYLGYTDCMGAGWILFIYLFLCVLVGAAASSKGRGYLTWTLISFLITPVLGGFFVAFMSNNQRKEKES